MDLFKLIFGVLITLIVMSGFIVYAKEILWCSIYALGFTAVWALIVLVINKIESAFSKEDS